MRVRVLVTMVVLALLAGATTLHAQLGNAGCTQLSGYVAEREQVVEGWKSRAMLLLTISIAICVFGAVTAIAQGFKQGKMVAVVLGGLITVLGGVKTIAFVQDHHAYERAANRARKHLESCKLMLLSCDKIDESSWSAYVQEIRKPLEAIDALNDKLTVAVDDATASLWGHDPLPTSLFAAPALAGVEGKDLPPWVMSPPTSNETSIWVVGAGRGATLQEAREAAARDTEERVEARLLASFPPRSTPPEDLENLRASWRAAMVEESTHFRFEPRASVFEYFRLVRVPTRSVKDSLRFDAVAKKRVASEQLIQHVSQGAIEQKTVPFTIYSKSEELLARTQEQMPEDLWTKFSDARYARLKGDYSAAVDGLTEVVNRDPSAYLAWFNLGLANDRLGKSAEAEAAYRRALELEQAQGLDDASIYNTFGYFLYRHGRSPEALPLLEKAVKIDPTHQKAAVNLQAVRAEVH